MGHLYIDGVLRYHTDPCKPIEPAGWTDEAWERELDYGKRLHNECLECIDVPVHSVGSGCNMADDHSAMARPMTIESLLARAAALSWRVKVIEVENRHGEFVWWADLYNPARVSRKHGYGLSLAEALAAALEAEEVEHDVPFAHHEVAKTRERPAEAAFVRRF